MKKDNESAEPILVDAPKPVLAKPNVISPIWLLPIVAIILGLYLAYQSISQAGIDIRIHFTNANGIVAGKTLVKYQGIVVGKVKHVAIDDDLNGVFVTASIDNKAEQVLRAKTQFWLITPKATIAGISGLDALVTGNYIDLAPGSGGFTTDFVAVDTPPSLLPESGLLLRLHSRNLGSVRVGADIYYKKIPVGTINNFKLDKQTDQLIIDAVIEDKYSYLVKDTSRFWNVSGINAEFGVDGISVQTESLSAIISGALAFDSPAEGIRAKANQSFTLYESVSAAERAIPIEFTLNEANSIKIGDNIYHNGKQVGEVVSINDKMPITVLAHVDPSIADYLREKTLFWLEKPVISLTGSKNLASLITGNFILFRPGDGAPATKFKLAASAADLLPGQHVALIANDANGLAQGNKIYYKNYPIGHIQSIHFNSKSDLIDVQTLIYQDFVHLLGSKTRFINRSGVDISANISGVNVNAGPLAAIVSGGIELVKDNGFSNNNSGHYRLYPSLALAKVGTHAFKAPTKVMLESFPSHVIALGAPVYYRKLQVGNVADFNLSNNNEQLLVTLDIESQYAHLVGPDSVFWDVSGIDVSGSLTNLNVRTDSLMAIAVGGINFDNIKQLKHTQQTSKSVRYRLYSSLAEATDIRPTITLLLESADNLTIGTQIKHKGISIGEISAINLDVENDYIEATAKLDNKYADYFMRQGSLFWLEHMEVSLSGVKNANTLLTGAYINTHRGNGAAQQRFSLLASRPLLAPDQVGLAITVVSDRLMELSVGAPVYYRQIIVGSITQSMLSAMGDKVLITLNIEPEFKHLVRQESQFWAISGFNVDVGLTGASLKAASLKTILAGGIAFATPKNSTAQVRPFSQFELAQEVNPEWLEWSTQLPAPKSTAAN